MATYQGHFEDSSGNNILPIPARVAPTEVSSTASQPYAVGEYLYFNNNMYKVTSAIAQGDTLVVGTNISAKTIGEELTAINKQLLPTEEGDMNLYDMVEALYKIENGIITPTGNAVVHYCISDSVADGGAAGSNEYFVLDGPHKTDVKALQNFDIVVVYMGAYQSNASGSASMDQISSDSEKFLIGFRQQRSATQYYSLMAIFAGVKAYDILTFTGLIYSQGKVAIGINFE